MTLKDIADMDCATITPAIAAAAVGCDPQYIRYMARTNPELLGFPTMVLGKRTRIPRLPFLAFMGWRDGS